MASAWLYAPPSALLTTGFLLPISRTQLPSITTSARVAPTLFQAPLTTRFKNVIRSQVRQRLITVLASNSNPQGGDSVKETSDNLAGSDAPQGPPFLTILAGLLVFLIVCWVFGSIVTWLFGLIVRLLPSK